MALGYNKGDAYEQLIFNILQQKGFLSPNATRAGAGTGVDIKFLHNSGEHNLEVKLDLNADYGQKMLRWDDGVWSWRVQDETTELYTSIGVLEYINQKNVIPYRYTIPQNELTREQKSLDQTNFEDRLSISISAVHSYYKSKGCFYMQVGGYGFYHLSEDVLGLKTPQFNCGIRLRLRAKTIHSTPIYKYGFYAVLKPEGKPKKSPYDIEEKDGRVFPPIFP
ncbi:hypothetical protein ACL6C3_00360 [Capilliphycus salinus ALCB114379]|uniref:hypothetical protein n=1 Tax=Capilliphycus salinus TaxID=2768948 RepID=UPI0039A6FAB9